MDNLKSCPFCGGANVNDTTPSPEYERDEGEVAFYLACPDCAACGPIHESEEEATKAWNKRADFSMIDGKQLVSEDAIKFLFDNHYEIYSKFYELV